MSHLNFYCKAWQLSEPEQIAQTFTSDVYRVKFNNDVAVLKILNAKGQEFESKGAAVLRCFNGNGAVRLLNADAGAHLLEFVDGQQLKSLVEQGNDDLATDVLCDVIQKIHSYSGPCPPELISMERNFRSLFEREKLESQDGIYARGAVLARELIETASDLRVLHGDIHHENILKHSIRGWLAIDPQCLFGERTYDLANTFYNPNGFSGLAANPDRIRRLAKKFSKALGIEEKRILQYAFAYGCLSASWCIEDGQSTDATLKITREIERLLPDALSAHSTTNKSADPDSHYMSPQLAELYDLDSGWSVEREFYLSLAGESRKRVLDLGCGTGLICNALAAKGHDVTGVDPAPAMLEVARQKPNGSKIEWVQSSAQNFKSDKLYDLIIMTGNAFQVLLEEADLLAACRVMRKHLAPDGLIAFESRNPHLDWAARWNYEIKLKTAVGDVLESRRFLYWSGNRMTFELLYQFPDEVLTSQSELRFWHPEEIAKQFKDAGLRIDRLMGDWDMGEFKEDSTEEMVFVIRRQG